MSTSQRPRLGPTRRAFLAAGGAAGVFLCLPRAARSAPSAKVTEIRTISLDNENYHGWPTLAKRANDELLLVFSGGREEHVCPFGRVELMRSHDKGETWTWPQVLLDSPIDDRDAGLCVTPQGTILVSTFTSLAYADILRRPATAEWPEEKLHRWQAAHHRVDEDARKQELSVWMIRSTDGGLTWSARFDPLVDSPHGPVALADGRLLYAGKDLWREPNRVGVCQSLDDGQSWEWLADLPVREGDRHQDYHELHAVEAASGKLILQIRNHNAKNAGETLQSESSDGGQSWTTPHSIGVWGLPSHLLRLHDDRLLMTYGHRRAPLGNQARLSSDEGETWSEPIMISTDGTSGDLGYPSTVQFGDGSLLTVWYERLASSPRAVLRQARWTLADAAG
jgi:sialidase-1